MLVGLDMTTPFRPVIVRSRGDFAKALANQRRAWGERCEDLDDRIGWSDRYTAKMEHPDSKSGKKSVRVTPMAECWLRAYGMVLVVMPEAQALELGAVPMDAAQAA